MFVLIYFHEGLMREEKYCVETKLERRLLDR